MGLFSSMFSQILGSLGGSIGGLLGLNPFTSLIPTQYLPLIIGAASGALTSGSQGQQAPPTFNTQLFWWNESIYTILV